MSGQDRIQTIGRKNKHERKSVGRHNSCLRIEVYRGAQTSILGGRTIRAAGDRGTVTGHGVRVQGCKGAGRDTANPRRTAGGLTGQRQVTEDEDEDSRMELSIDPLEAGKKE